MKNLSHSHSDSTPAPSCNEKSCATGTCGGPGICPGIAIFIAWALGIGTTTLTGIAWLGWAIGIPLAFILLTGAWRWLPGKRDATTPPHHDSHES